MQIATFWFVFSIATSSMVWALVERRLRQEAQTALRRRELIEMVADLERFEL